MLPTAVAARAVPLAGGREKTPRAALLAAVEASARGALLQGGGSGSVNDASMATSQPPSFSPAFHVPPGVTAIFVPADALPDATRDTPPDDLVAFLIPDEEVELAMESLGVERQSELPTGDSLSRSFTLSNATEELLADLNLFLDRAPLEPRWRALLREQQQQQ